MSCTKRFLNVEWDRHSWVRRVTSTETVAVQEVRMWGNIANKTYVRCHAEYVCQECGTTREEGNCLCDTEHAEQCAVRLACLAQVKNVPVA